MSKEIDFLYPTESSVLVLIFEDTQFSKIYNEREQAWRKYIDGLARITLGIKSDGSNEISWTLRDIACIATYAVSSNEESVYKRTSDIKFGNQKEKKLSDRIATLNIQFREIKFDPAQKIMFLFFSQVVYDLKPVITNYKSPKN